MTCCEVFRNAVENHDILFISKYYDSDDKVDIPLDVGYYIQDTYASGEMCDTDKPLVENKLIFCPWCGTKL